MKRWALLWVLLALPALAQQSVTRGGALKKRQYQTYGTMTLYMDPAGSDSNSCTAAGAANACLTFNGIYAKLPRILRHNVTVNVAAGNYSFSSRWSGAQWASASTSGSTGVTVDFMGPAFVNVTPTTGTATGTLTSVSTSPVPLPTLTDSGQSWTTNDLRGYFLMMTSGAANGLYVVITGNTATTLTHTPWPNASVPSAGDTYAIQKPGATITGEHIVSEHVGANGTLRYSQLEFTSSSTSANTFGIYYNSGFGLLGFGSSRLIKTTGTYTALYSIGSPAPFASGGSYTQPRMAVMSLGTGIAYNSSSPTNPSALTIRAYAYAAGNSAFYLSGPTSAYVTWPTVVAETGSTSATYSPIVVTRVPASGGGPVYHGMYAICPVGSAATQPGLRLESASLSTSIAYVKNCGTGISLNNFSPTVSWPPSYVTTFLNSVGGNAPQLYCDGTTTCISVGRAARATITVGKTFSGVTNEYTVDGVSYTDTFINNLSPKRVAGNAGSIVEFE